MGMCNMELYLFVSYTYFCYIYVNSLELQENETEIEVHRKCNYYEREIIDLISEEFHRKTA